MHIYIYIYPVNMYHINIYPQLLICNLKRCDILYDSVDFKFSLRGSDDLSTSLVERVAFLNHLKVTKFWY